VSLLRALSKMGVCSRSEAQRRILAGRVKLNGITETRPHVRLDPARDRVSVDGVLASDRVARVVLALHKPAGYVTTRVDPAGRLTVYHLLDEVASYVFPVGRLDRDSSGLLLLTNDHRLGHRLTDPEHHVPKTYHVRVRGVPAAPALHALREGVALPDGALSRPARVRSLGSPRAGESWLEVVLEEGRNRQVRHMCAAVGHDVLELVRVQIGSLALGDLPSGSWRELGEDEVRKALQKPR
jgi:23S rRNA pseudouridine2605 synthase